VPVETNVEKQSTPSRAARERQFHEDESRVFTWARRRLNRAKAGFVRSDEIENFFEPDAKVALDYGCGVGPLLLRLLQVESRHVWGFDISEVRIREAQELVEAQGYADRASLLVADAHKTPFENCAFDLVVGNAILHHLDLNSALQEIQRILKPGGTAVFSEPLLHNPMFRIGRALTPFARTPDESPLASDDWEVCASVFSNFRHYEMELISTLFIPLGFFLPVSWRRVLARRLFALDDWLLTRFPSLRKYTRMTIIVCQRD
jgi:SAM-dependent methyltransferase